MGDPVHEAIFEALDAAYSAPPTTGIDMVIFEDVLASLGWIIVPIEDPTNLGFGVDD